jgi:hypothetical protein
MQDFTVYTKDAKREATCPACRWNQRADEWPADQSPPDRHTCRQPPATPRAVVNERTRAAEQVLTERELGIRKVRVAEINASAHRRG